MLFESMLAYAMGVELAPLSPLAKMAFNFIKRQMDYDNAKYLKTCEKNRKNAEKRWSAKDAIACDSVPSDAKHADKDKDKYINKKEKLVEEFCLVKFEKLWKAYPNKKNKKQARVKFFSLIRKDGEAVLDKLEQARY